MKAGIKEFSEEFENLLSADLKARLKTGGLEKLLDSLGDERLAQKKARMANLLKIANPNEALYRETMLALGYRNNKVQFLELALILPYSEIYKIREAHLIERALLYRAGFLNTKKGLPEDFDFSLKMDNSVWHRKGIRPENYPEKRIKNISRFLSMSCQDTQGDGLVSFIKKRIVDSFSETVDKRYAVRFCSSVMEVFTENNIKAVGKARSLEIFFNIILPFFTVLFEQEVKKGFSNLLFNIYTRHPSLEDNSPTKAMKHIIFGEDKEKAKGVINSVRRYMGLICLYNKIISTGEK